MAALSQPELIYSDSSTLPDLERSYATCPLQRKLDDASAENEKRDYAVGYTDAFRTSAAPMINAPRTIHMHTDIQNAAGSLSRWKYAGQESRQPAFVKTLPGGALRQWLKERPRVLMARLPAH